MQRLRCHRERSRAIATAQSAACTGRELDGGVRAFTLAAIDHELRRRELETREAEGVAEAAGQRRLAEIELLLAESRALRELVKGMPQLAAAMQPKAETLHLTQIGAGDGPLAAVPQAVGQVVALAKSLGLGMELPKPR